MSTELSQEFKAFLKLVAEMRKSQREFFHKRDRDSLHRSKLLEIQVDHEIDALTSEQPTLF